VSVHLCLILAGHFLLTALPGVAAALLGARLGVRSVSVLLAIGMAATGVLAMVAFWSYYGSRMLGETYSFVVFGGSALTVGSSLRGGRIDPGLLRQLATPLALWALGSVFLVCLGFMHGGSESAIAMSSSRFSGQLPSDNDIPRYFSEWFYLHSHSGQPVYPPDWLASDRPPMQVGYVLSQRVFGDDTTALHYQIIGVILQQMWIVGLWALLLAARVGRITRALTIVTVLLSGVAIVNGFFVWPKLLPTAMLLAAAALLITPMWEETRSRIAAGGLVGALFALAMLGHGSSVFGIIPLGLLAAFRAMPGWRWLAVALLAGLVLLAPWSAYQKYGEPPGNRLLKYQLAGVPEIDSRGTLQTLADSYGESGVGGVLHNKAENFVTMAGGGPMVNRIEIAINAAESGHVSTSLAEVRNVIFFYLLPSLSLLLIAPLLMLLARRRRSQRPAEWRFSLICFAVVGIAATAWGLLMFGNETSRAVLHQGSFLLPVLGLVGATCGLRAVFPRFAIYFSALASLLSLAIYVPALTPLQGTSFSPLAVPLTIISLVGFVAVAFLWPRGSAACAASQLATAP